MSTPLTKKNGKNVILSLHLLVWGGLFLMPLLFTIGENYILTERDTIIMIFRRTWLPLIFSAVIFYINYLFLLDRFLFRREILSFVVYNALAIVLFVWLTDYIKSCTPFNIPPPMPGKGYMIYKLVFSYMVTIGFSIAVRITQNWVQDEAKRKSIAHEQLQSELTYLQYQIQPHFFFNSLNNIYSMVDTAPEEAKTNIHGLAKLMRYMLYEAKGNKVPLSKEVEFLQRFISLMKVRLSNQTNITAVFPENVNGFEVAPLLFIPLVENAFKHGVSSMQATDIRIEMKIEGGMLHFYTENTNMPKSQEDKSGSGIGLNNLRKRLELLYKDKHIFRYGIKDSMFYTQLTLEL